MKPWDRLPDSPNCVTIFGGGIAGLTAAQEFVERGFRVQLWEPASDPRYPQRGCDVGGMARTQWSRVHWADAKGLDHFHPAPAHEATPSIGIKTQPIVQLPQKVTFERAPDIKLLMRRATVSETAVLVHLEDEAWKPDWKEIDGVELRVHNWGSMSEAQQASFAKNAATALTTATAAAGGRTLGPYFDRSQRVWKFSFTSAEGKKIEVVFVGGFAEALAGISVPGSVQAYVHFWQGDQFKITDTVCVLYEDWEPGNPYFLGAWGASDGKTVFKEFADTLLEHPEIRYLYVEVSDPEFARLQRDERLDRADKILRVLEKFFPDSIRVDEPSRQSEAPPSQAPPSLAPPSQAPPSGNAVPRRRLRMGLLLNPGNPEERRRVELEIVPLEDFPSEPPKLKHCLIGFRVRERWFPGEHGYRFFPSFYRHVFDTMKRIPILEPVPKSKFLQDQERAVHIDSPEPARYSETERTVFDNIHPTSSHVLAFGDGQPPTVLPRSMPKSFEELREYVHVLFGAEAEGGFAVNPRESTRYALKLFKYMTSCEERREQYEKMSWWDFVDGDSYSPEVQRLLERWPEALVAMDAKTSDARSHGNAVVQLTLDNLRRADYRDGTLRGPTSEAWFKYWRRYLEAQGVEFIHGRLVGAEVVTRPDGKQQLWPKVRCFEPRIARDENQEPLLMPGYFVLATSALAAKGLAKTLRDKAEEKQIAAPAEVSDLAHTASIDASNLDQAEPNSDFRHFAGIQFYFAEDVFWVDGHVYYPNSPWGLTSISQARFWEERTDWEHGFRGVVSAIIGVWNQPGEYIKKRAWDCTPEELAQEVWYQIKNSVKGQVVRNLRRKTRFEFGSRSRDGDVPDPLYWHLDDLLAYGEGGFRNQSPFHIASPKGWPRRPGDPEHGYKVENGWVVCGMFAKTFTRIPTMEAANESARHAVNAVLAQLERHRGDQPRYRGTRCDVWDPEDSEIEDLEWFRNLDEKLVKRGLDHVIDILDVDRLIDSTLRGGEDDPLDPINVMRELGRLSTLLPRILSPWRY